MANLNPPVVETNWAKTMTEDKKPRSRGHEKFLQFVKKGPGEHIKHSRRAKIFLESSTVTTVSFEPTPQYVAEAVKAPAVKAWLKKPKQRLAPVVSLYLVTGMKLAKGAHVKYSISVNTVIRTRIRTSTGLLVPELNYGLKYSYAKSYNDDAEYKVHSEFIFAFRVKRLRFRYGRDVTIEEFTRGALLESAKGESGSEMESALVNDADGDDVESDTDDEDVGNDSDGDAVRSDADGHDVGSDADDHDIGSDADSHDVGNNADGNAVGSDANGANIKNGADSSGIRTSRLVFNVAKNINLMSRSLNKIFHP